jgi:hypothetical protein
MIIQYLSDEGYTASKMTVYDEANVKWHEREERIVEVKRLKKAILGNIDVLDSVEIVLKVACQNSILL